MAARVSALGSGRLPLSSSHDRWRSMASPRFRRARTHACKYGRLVPYLLSIG
jgi:hypothetical protein